MIRALVLGVLAAVMLPPVAAAQAPFRDRLWLTAGVGAGSEDLGLGAALSFARQSHLLSLRAAATLGPFDVGYWDLSLLYGRNWREGRRAASLAAGVAVVDGELCEGLTADCGDPAGVFGFPIEAQLSWLATPALGVGLYGYANVNSLKTFAGVLAVVQVGRLR